MKGVAAWLVARPQNAVVVLAATIAFGTVPPLAHFAALSGIVLIMLVLHEGVRTAVVKVVFAGIVAAGAGLLVGVAPVLVAGAAASVWLPSLLLSVLLVTTRSLTLTLQLSVIIAVSVMLAFFVAVGNPAEFWLMILDPMIEVWREVGQDELADLVEPQKETFAAYATMVAVMASWILQASSLVLGYALYKQLPDETANYGRFQDLSFGRVIALTMAVASVASMVVDAVWLQSLAFVLFAAFFLQGLAVVHWMYARGVLQLFGLVATYALMLIAGWFVLPALAIFGYTDAWFDFRRTLRQRLDKQD